MPSYRDIGKEYELSQARYRELMYFCRQYDEKKEIIGDLHYEHGFQSGALTGQPLTSGAGESVVERRALKALPHVQDVEMIDRCLDLAVGEDKGIIEALRLNVTRGIKWEYLNVPCGKSKFYNVYRRYFFWLLDQRK